VYRSIIVGDLVKLHSCICRCELIELSRRVFYACVNVYASSVSCQVWRVTSQSQPTRAAWADGRSTAAWLSLHTPIHSVSVDLLIAPRRTSSCACLSSCLPGALPVPRPGHFIQESWSAVQLYYVCLRRYFTSRFLLCLDFYSEYECFTADAAWGWRGRLAGGAVRWCGG